MITMSEHIREERPFDEVFIHGLVRDKDGRKISKSLGNNIDPIEVIDTYGADAMRFALIQLITHGQDLKYSDDRILAARNFANKLWNAARFVMMNIDDDAEPVDLSSVELSLADRWILSRHNAATMALNAELSEYNLAQGADILWEHVWDEFCDWYLELCKPDLYGDRTPERKAIVQTILREVLSGILRALHPFTPFVTEAIWQNFAPEQGSICVAPYPEGDAALVDEQADAQMRLLQAVISTVRNLRAVVGLPPSQGVRVTLLAGPTEAAVVSAQEAGISALAAVEALDIQPDTADAPDGALGDVAENVRVFLHIEGDIDIQGEIERLETEIGKLEKLNRQCRGKLENENFVNRAPADVVELERKRLEENTAAIEKLTQQAELMRGLLD
jgi:valyl-tRNA synthetase